MSKKYCKYLANGINFHISGLSFCNKLWWNYNPYTQYGPNALEYFLQKREETLANLDKGCVPEHCQNCMYMQEINEDEFSDKIKYIEIYHWNQCNCACFYCSNRETTKLKITKWRHQQGVIKVMPMLKELQNRNMFDKDMRISLVGGEPTLLNEFTDILKFTIKHQYSIDILSNGILYEKYIPKTLMSTPESYITISLDCGSRELFKKIKGVDKFNDVVKNIKRYVKESKEAGSRVMAKYIILQGVNDNKEEIDKWIETCVDAGVTNYFPSIEFCHSVKEPEKHEITDKVCELYEYMKSKLLEKNPDFRISEYDFVKEFIKNRSYKIK
jgi:molybdenum cofactor biosynthesis enzyme MoaA